mmetsp:Transcript_58463/g.136631  ORF Transcript_58463/g.136631 Transcript_58463/m.136631 type:complete len:223 (-) Transcript_58463:1439-2107(-)
MLPVSAIAKVTLHRENRLTHVLGILGLAEANHICQPWVRLLVVVREAQAAANGNIKAKQPVVLNDGNETSAVCKDVDIIGRWDCNGHLELTWQVGEAIQWLLFDRSAAHDLHLLCHFLTVHEEDLMVGSRPRQTMVMDCIRVLQDLFHDLCAAYGWIRCAENVPANIAASSNGVHACAVDSLHGCLDVALEHPVHLPCLTSCDLQCGVCEPLANVIHAKPLL